GLERVASATLIDRKVGESGSAVHCRYGCCAAQRSATRIVSYRNRNRGGAVRQVAIGVLNLNCDSRYDSLARIGIRRLLNEREFARCACVYQERIARSRCGAAAVVSCRDREVAGVGNGDAVVSKNTVCERRRRDRGTGAKRSG